MSVSQGSSQESREGIVITIFIEIIERNVHSPSYILFLLLCFQNLVLPDKALQLECLVQLPLFSIQIPVEEASALVVPLAFFALWKGGVCFTLACVFSLSLTLWLAAGILLLETCILPLEISNFGLQNLLVLGYCRVRSSLVVAVLTAAAASGVAMRWRHFSASLTAVSASGCR